MPRNVRRAVSRARDEGQQAELSAFVNSLADAAGYKTTADWARESGYPAPNLSNLRNRRGGIDGYNLMRLIRAAAARIDAQPEEIAAGALPVTDAATILARIDHLDSLVGQALEGIHERLREPKSTVVDFAEDLLRRRDEGEDVPAAVLAGVAAQMERTSTLCRRLAGRLRRAAQAAD